MFRSDAGLEKGRIRISQYTRPRRPYPREYMPDRSRLRNGAVAPGAPSIHGQEFIGRIDIASTRAYVTSILDRYHE